VAPSGSSVLDEIVRERCSRPAKIWLANPKLSRTIVPMGAYCQTEPTPTKAVSHVTHPATALP
jgi:hypothetical protein